MILLTFSLVFFVFSTQNDAPIFKLGKLLIGLIGKKKSKES